VSRPKWKERTIKTSATFSTSELAYLLGNRLLGRLATIEPSGAPHVVPVGWSYNEKLGTIDITGRNFAASKKFRNASANDHVAFLVDDVVPPWQPRSVMVQGRAEALLPGTIENSGPQALIRITPEKIVSWGLEAQT
jgi:PPOX class F420-dependent enzyme/OxyR family protein